jgi:thiamine biosynthesis protein ThiI
VALLSGGIDSPVAAWMMMTRGLALTLVHCHSAPYTSGASQEKVRELARSLTRFQPRIELLMVPFADPIQTAIVAQTPARYRVVLYRRFMLRMALQAALARRAKAIVTGEALGQVASQTIENMTAVEAVASLPVLRPLVGLGKGSIIERARQIGTYRISIQPHEDCCGYLMPRNPATRTDAAELDEVERSLDIADLVRRTWIATERAVVRASPAVPGPDQDPDS